MGRDNKVTCCNWSLLNIFSLSYILTDWRKKQSDEEIGGKKECKREGDRERLRAIERERARAMILG